MDSLRKAGHDALAIVVEEYKVLIIYCDGCESNWTREYIAKFNRNTERHESGMEFQMMVFQETCNIES